MPDNNNKGFKLLLHGELMLSCDERNSWQLPSIVPTVDIDLAKAVRDPKAFDEAARIIGREVMKRGVRYAARGVRQWEQKRPPMVKKDPKTEKARALLSRLSRC